MALQAIDALWEKVAGDAAYEDHICYVKGVTIVKPVRVINLIRTVTSLEATTDLDNKLTVTAADTACPDNATNAT